VISSPAGTLVAGGTAGLAVQHAPQSHGTKTAVLHITSNAENPHGNYDITLTNHAELPVPGTRDASFNPFVTNVYWVIAVQADGKIIIGNNTPFHGSIPTAALTTPSFLRP
jgi:hypothetical protein